ncbi:MAG: transposase [Bdellovibrionota bacterium]
MRDEKFPYHITARANNRETFPGVLEYVWKVFTDELYLQHLCHRIRIHAFVLMPNHLHLMITSPERGIDLVMKEFLSSSTRILNTRSGRSGHIFGGRYYWSLIKEPAYYAHTLKYVYRNPVKAALCDDVGDYRFSTYPGLVGRQPLPIPLFYPDPPLGILLPVGVQEMDTWLNTAHKKEQNDAIKRALKRQEFQFACARESRRVVNFEI